MNGEIVHVGTSGWHYDHWEGPFYPDGTSGNKQLDYYARQFNTVEINNTFYKLPEEKALKDWYEDTPNDFLFSIKASRYITHLKNLMDVEEPLDKFLKRIRGLKEKLGAILFQLPPRWNINLERFENFSNLIPEGLQIAVEFRNSTWHTEKIYKILKEKNIAFCIWELAGEQSPVMVTANFCYIRLHGPDGAYKGDYSDEILRGWAEKIEDWKVHGKEIYLYFDNDQMGFAPKNAKQIIKIIEDMEGG